MIQFVWHTLQGDIDFSTTLEMTREVLVSSRPKRRDLATHPFCETEGGGRVDMHDVAQYIFYDVVGGIGRGLRKITNRKFSNFKYDFNCLATICLF